jgi:hypothetical protein
MTKDAAEVVHTPERLEDYVQKMVASEGHTFEEWVRLFSGGFYKKRNEIIVELLRPLVPRRVFEFACAGGFLADMLLRELDSIEVYTCTNFSPQMLEFCQRQLGGHPRCEVALADADVTRSNDISTERLVRYDVVLTTSFEHIQHDYGLIERLPDECEFVFSVATFDDPEHFRHFSSEDEIRSRYGRVLEFETIAPVDGYKFVALARRRR